MCSPFQQDTIFPCSSPLDFRPKPHFTFVSVLSDFGFCQPRGMERKGINK